MSNQRAILFSLPVFGGGLLNYCVSAQFQIYATDVLFLSAGFIGVIFLIMRVYDAVSDPLIGILSDKTKSRFGRRKIWMLASALPVALGFYGLWQSSEALGLPVSQEVFTAIALFVFFTALSALYVPHYSLSAEMVHDDYSRNRLFGSRAILETLGTVGGVAVIAMIDKKNALASATLLMAIVAFVYLFLLSVFGISIKEKTVTVNAQNTRFSFGFLKNKFFMRILLLSFISQSVATILLGGIPYFARYVIDSANYESAFQVAFILPAILAVPAWVLASKKIAKTRLWLLANSVMAVSMLAMFFLPAQSHIVMMALCALCGTSAGCALLVNPSLMADAIDYEESLSHSRTEGLFFAIFTFNNKCAMGFAVFLFSLTLELSGYQANSVQNETTIMAIKITYILVPVVLLTVSAIVLKTVNWSLFYGANAKAR